MNDVLKNIYSRRSVRRYTDESIDESLIEQILDAGRMAPSAMNVQPWHFYVVNDATLIHDMDVQIKKAMQKIYDGFGTHEFLNNENPIFHQAPVVIFISAPAASEWAGLDAGMCAQNMMLAAKAVGLDSCPVGLGKLIDKTALYSQLGVAEGESILLSLTFGFGAEEPAAPLRKKDNVKFVRASAIAR